MSAEASSGLAMVLLSSMVSVDEPACMFMPEWSCVGACVPPSRFIMLGLPSSWAAASTLNVPLVTITSPSVNPAFITHPSPSEGPSVTSRILKTGSSLPCCFTYTTDLTPVQSTADCGMTSSLPYPERADCTTPVANISGLSLPDRLSASTRTFATRVTGSITGSIKAMMPVNSVPGYALSMNFILSFFLRNCRSLSYASNITQTFDRSAIL